MTQELTQAQRREKLQALLATAVESVVTVTEGDLVRARTIIQEVIDDLRQQDTTVVMKIGQD